MRSMLDNIGFTDAVRRFGVISAGAMVTSLEPVQDAPGLARELFRKGGCLPGAGRSYACIHRGSEHGFSLRVFVVRSR